MDVVNTVDKVDGESAGTMPSVHDVRSVHRVYNVHTVRR